MHAIRWISPNLLGIVGLTLGTNEDMRVLCPIFPVVQSLNWETKSEMI